MTAVNDCGCCEGLTVETPVAVSNRPGLSAIVYRAGTHAQFKASMLARLSAADLPELGKLKTRDDDDFTIALLDAWALAGDILTFYQERIANELYLRTATARQSVINLARLIGYELRPGVAATTYLAFTLETGTGSPTEVALDKGVRVQSVPGPGEKPQTFETVEKVIARPEWNALKPRLTEIRRPQFGDLDMVLRGVTTNLKPGDALLIVGAERLADPKNDSWDFRRITSVEADPANDRTTVRWSHNLGSQIPPSKPPQKDPRVYALRLKASLFGFNAPDWNALPVALRVGEKNPDPTGSPTLLIGVYANALSRWANVPFQAGTKLVNLDSVYNQIAVDSWIVLASPDYAEVYSVTEVAEEAKADFNLSAKTTRLQISGENIEKFSPCNCSVFAQSEELELGGTPILEPVWKKEIILDAVVDGLEEGRTLIVSGRRMRVTIPADARDLVLKSADGKTSVTLSVGDSLIVAALPAAADGDPAKQRWQLIYKTGFEGYVEADLSAGLSGSDEDDDNETEVAELKQAVPDTDAQHTILKLGAALANVYDRTTVKIYGNVALSTHGETVKDQVLGSGDAGRPYQHFALRQSPLTYTPADTASGGTSTLEVRVNELEWMEVPTLFGRGPRERIYVTRIDDDGTATVQFGDGNTGARLPMGPENVRATYRKGIGLAGLVKAGQLTLLMTRPLGLRGVTNPMASSGAQDPQSLANARTNAPVTVLTLDRIVSLQDYEDFARAFSGIAKALATWTWSGHARQVFVTVAGIDGEPVAGKSVLQATLLSAMQKAGDGFVPITIKSYRAAAFKVVASVKSDPAYVTDTVLAAVEAALRASFSFDARSFGQSVTQSEVVTVMQAVAGVIAVDVTKLHRADRPEARETFLPSDSPQVGAGPTAAAAELLTLDAQRLELTVMP